MKVIKTDFLGGQGPGLREGRLREGNAPGWMLLGQELLSDPPVWGSEGWAVAPRSSGGDQLGLSSSTDPSPYLTPPPHSLSHWEACCGLGTGGSGWGPFPRA